MPDGGNPGAAARISITRLPDAAALQTAIRLGIRRRLARRPSGQRRRPPSPCRRPRSPSCASIRRSHRSPTSACGARCRSRSTGARWRVSDGGDVVPARSLLLDPQAPGRPARRPLALLARSCAAPGPRTRASICGRSRAHRRASRGRSRAQLAAVGVQVTVRVRAGARPRRRAAWIEWLSPAYGDPAAIFMPLADALVDGPQAALAARVSRRRPAGRRCPSRGLPAPRRAPRRRRTWRDSAAACKLFHAGLVHAGGKRHPPGVRPRPLAALHTTMTAPRPHNQLPPLCEMARLWISMAADGECGEVERAALDEHLEHCDECTEWRALAEAVVLHVRTTPPSPVPAGLLPDLHAQARAAPRPDGARRRRRRGRRCCGGARRRRRGLEFLARRTSRRRRASCARPRSSSGGIRATRWTAARCPASASARRARRPDFVTPPAFRAVWRDAACLLARSTRRVDASGRVRAPRES